MDDRERILRIAQMEELMDESLAAARSLEWALENWEAAQPSLETLAAYYEGPLWREDFEADEAGKLPPELKRGVLSEDGLYDLLERARELDSRILEREA